MCLGLVMYIFAVMGMAVFAKNEKITPAVFEQFCSEFDEVEDFVAACMGHFDGGTC